MREQKHADTAAQKTSTQTLTWVRMLGCFRSAEAFQWFVVIDDIILKKNCCGILFFSVFCGLHTRFTAPFLATSSCAKHYKV